MTRPSVSQQRLADLEARQLRQQRTQAMATKAAALYEEGLDFTAIAARLGVNKGTAARWVKMAPETKPPEVEK